MDYPFRPKSTRFLIPGQFWAIPVPELGFACGRVIELCIQDGKQDSRLFLAGLMNWAAKTPPDATVIAGCKTIAQGQAHIKTILQSDGTILGHRSLEIDRIEPALFLSESPGPGCMLMKGTTTLRRATAEEQKALPVFSTWGYKVIVILAKKLLSK